MIILPFLNVHANSRIPALLYNRARNPPNPPALQNAEPGQALYQGGITLI